jgi:hypothetical protein
MAALIDIEAPETQLLPRPHLSQDTFAAMVLLYEGALEITGINASLQPNDRGTALGARYPKASLSDSSTLLGQIYTHSVTMDFEPALSTRSPDKVIEELKRGRYQRQKIHSSLPVANNPLSNQHHDVSSIPGPSQSGGNSGEAEDVESELEEEVFVPKKPRKISERKRIQNAAQESWFQSYQRQQAKAASNISNVDTEALSIRYLVRQAESQRIISSPREYQVELFERAKEQNIIAVLDTGKPCLSWS